MDYRRAAPNKKATARYSKNNNREQSKGKTKETRETTKKLLSLQIAPSPKKERRTVPHGAPQERG